MAKIYKSKDDSFENRGVSILRHKEDPDRFAVRFGADVFQLNAETALMLASGILVSLERGGKSIDWRSVDTSQGKERDWDGPEPPDIDGVREDN